MVNDVSVRELEPGDIDACRNLLDALPDWFGLPDENQKSIASLRELPAFVVVDNDEVIGFLALKAHTATSIEITVMGIRPDRHRRGAGRKLVGEAIRWSARRGGRWLHVKTRGPSTYDDNYERTRQFYLAMGFEPLYESLTEWGPDDAALVLVMALDPN